MNIYIIKILKLIWFLYKTPSILYRRFIILQRLNNSLFKSRFNRLNSQYAEVFSSFNVINSLDRSSNGYSWDSWSGKIRSSFENGVNIGFLNNHLIAFTMVFIDRGWSSKATKIRISACKDIFGNKISEQLLLEDYIGLPTISNSKFMTSANRAHHSSHLAYFYRLSGKYFWAANTIVEFGGGYGNMARIIRRMNPQATYIIIDLPELLSLQYVYLGSLEGDNAINIINSDKLSIIAGKINLISSELLIAANFQLKCDAFISTWALTECPEYIQQYVNKNSFFSAKNVFIASCIDQNNYLKKLVDDRILKRIRVPDLNDIHEYWLITNE